jgi:hypothetical protein
LNNGSILGLYDTGYMLLCGKERLIGLSQDIGEVVGSHYLGIVIVISCETDFCFNSVNNLSDVFVLDSLVFDLRD